MSTYRDCSLVPFPFFLVDSHGVQTYIATSLEIAMCSRQLRRSSCGTLQKLCMRLSQRLRMHIATEISHYQGACDDVEASRTINKSSCDKFSSFSLVQHSRHTRCACTCPCCYSPRCMAVHTIALAGCLILAVAGCEHNSDWYQYITPLAETVSIKVGWASNCDVSNQAVQGAVALVPRAGQGCVKTKFTM